MALGGRVSVLIYDSGVGGLPYLGELQRRLGRQVGILYFADSEYFPFGDKPESELARHIVGVVDALVHRCSPSLVLLACNTASVLALERLRGRIKVPVVGTVPAIKPAAASSPSHRIALLATERTLATGYLDRLIALHAGGCEVRRLAASPLVDFIENGLFRADEREVRRHLVQVAGRVAAERVDRVVLGCTHFLHVVRPMREMLPKGVKLVDSLEGVTVQVLRLLNQKETRQQRTIAEQILWTASSGERWHYWAKRYHLRLHEAGV